MYISNLDAQVHQKPDPVVQVKYGTELAHPEEVVFHADGELVAAQPQHAYRRDGELRDAASDAGQLTAEQLLPVQRRLTETSENTDTQRFISTRIQ